MSVKIRLQRFGKKNQSFYHIVVADARAPRDGKFIEQLGIYNPRTNPATIELNTEKTLNWLENGAQASDTCRAILSYRGVMFRKHLNEGVRKKAISQEEADTRYAAWLEQKNLAISQKAQNAVNLKKDELEKRLTEEAKVRDKIAEKVTAKKLAASEAIEAEARKAAQEVAAATAAAIAGEAPADPPEAPADPPAAATESTESQEASAATENPPTDASAPDDKEPEGGETAEK